MAISHVFTNNVADATGTLTIWNGATTATVAASDIVKPSHWNSAHNQYYTLSGNTSNASTASGTNVVFQGGANVTLSGATGTIVFSARGPNTFLHYPPWPMPLATSSAVSGTTAATGGSTQTTCHFYLAPFPVQDEIQYNQVRMYIVGGQVAGTGSWSGAHMVGLYTLNGGTAFSLERSWVANVIGSQNSATAQSVRVYWGTDSAANSTSWNGNSSASYTGWRQALLHTGGSTLTPGNYYIVHGHTYRSSNSSVGMLNTAAYLSLSQTTGGAMMGQTSSLGPYPKWVGSFSSTSNNTTTGFVVLPASINTSALTYTGGSSQIRWPIIYMVSS